MDDMFERASRAKLRFASVPATKNSPSGFLSVEDLWDIRLTDLDAIFKSLKKDIGCEQEESLLSPSGTPDPVALLKVNLIKHIAEVRLREAEAVKLAKERKMKKQKLMEILERKENQEVEGKSADEIRAMINELD
jgi:hypothetical protein